MEHGKESDLGAQMLGVSRDGAQRLSGSPEQNVVDVLFILEVRYLLTCNRSVVVI